MHTQYTKTYILTAAESSTTATEDRSTEAEEDHIVIILYKLPCPVADLPILILPIVVPLLDINTIQLLIIITSVYSQ